MKSLSLFWRELKRRNVLKRIASYVVFSWVLLQVIVVISSLIAVPDWLGKAILIVLLIFFPLWIVFSWYYDITPSGIKKIESSNSEVSEAQKVAISKRLNIFIVVFLALAVILLVSDRMRLTSHQQKQDISEVINNSNSIAVLPFKDISVGKDQAYFADGLAEELINMLSRISNIKVTSRTSAFSFKDKLLDIPAIAKQLNVKYILEGSVRTHDSIIRVSVQLINTKDDSYSWSQTWDKKLENIFSIQDEISKIVAEKLELEITDNFLKPDEKVNPEAYRLYLKALYEINNIKEKESFNVAERFLKESIALDSVFTPSWNLLSHVYHQQTNENLIALEKGYPLAKNAALKALEIDSTYASVYDILGTIAIDYEKDFEKAQQLVNKGLSIEPQNTEVMKRASEVARIMGDFKKAIHFEETIVALNPLEEKAHYGLARTYYFAKEFKKAEKTIRRAIEIDPTTQVSHYTLASALLFQGKLKEALEAAKKEPLEPLRLQILSMINYKLGNKQEAKRNLEAFINKHEEDWSYQIACVYAFQNNKDQAFLWLDKAIFYVDFGIIESTIEPTLDGLKEDVRWQQFLDKRGFFINRKN